MRDHGRPVGIQQETAAWPESWAQHPGKTLVYENEDGTGETRNKSMHCAGAMIVLEHEERPNQIMRIGERLGFYDRSALVMDSPVPASLDEWVGVHSGRQA